jgi:nucleotide-binding universal stress UspA family protein
MGRGWRRLLFASDFSEGCQGALEEVTELARTFECEVIVANVQASPWRSWFNSHLEARHRADRLELVVSRLEQAGIRARSHFIADGEVSRALVGLAEYEHADLLVVGSSSRQSHAFRRSTAEQLVRRASIPVWVSKAPGAGPRHVLCGVDGSEASRQALLLAAQLSRSFEGRLSVVHALGHPPFNPFGLSASEVAERMGAYRADMQEQMDRFIASAGRPERARLLWGEPHAVLCAFALEERVDLVVTGRTGKGGLRRLVLGSTAEQLVRHPCASLLLLGEGQDPLFERASL